jgi:hypothetical protein
VGSFPNPYRKTKMENKYRHRTGAKSVLRAFPGRYGMGKEMPGKGLLSVHNGRKGHRGMTVYLSSFPGVYPLNL